MWDKDWNAGKTEWWNRKKGMMEQRNNGIDGFLSALRAQAKRARKNWSD